MAQSSSVVSSDYPFLTIRVTIRGHQSQPIQALVDTGFSGHLVIPLAALEAGTGIPDSRVDWQLADGSMVDAPIYFGLVELGGLPPIRAIVTVLGGQYILGRGVVDRYRVTFDHGKQVLVDP